MHPKGGQVLFMNRKLGRGDDMKEFMEEYGGILLACFMGMLMLGILTLLTAPDGGLCQLAKIFAQSIGTS